MLDSLNNSSTFQNPYEWKTSLNPTLAVFVVVFYILISVQIEILIDYYYINTFFIVI